MAAASHPSASVHYAGGEPLDGGDSACSTPFVSAPSSPARDAPFPAAAGCFFSAPASPSRAGEDFDFDFSRFPPPAAVAMSSADELFHNGQIRPARFLDLPADHPPPPEEVVDERGRLRSRSVHRRSRSFSPFRTHWTSPSLSRPPAVDSEEPSAIPAASRSSSSSSTASSASSSSSRSSRRWGFFKDLLHRSKSDGGKQPPPPSPLPPAAAKQSPSPATLARGSGRRRRSAHERLYEARRAEAEVMRRRTFLPYRQGLLLGCLGFSSRGYGTMHGFARGLDAAAAASRS